LKGSTANSITNNFKIGSIFIVDKAGKVKKTTALPTTVYNASTCTTTNVLKSLAYRVFYQEDRYLGHYRILQISLDILLQDSLTLDAKFCQSQPSKSFFSYS